MSEQSNIIERPTTVRSMKAKTYSSWMVNGYEMQADFQTRRPKVLMYHRIVDDRELSRTEQTCVHIDEFHKQLELIDQLGYTPVTFDDYHLSQEGKIQLPRKPIILTFDDGYLDTYRNAFPLLNEYGMKAVVFVIGDKHIHINAWDAENPNISKALLMNNDQIATLSDHGFEIGVHTLTHPSLTDLSEEEYLNEIKTPKIVMEGIIGNKIHSFSYPYGKVNSSVKKFVKQSGYRYACSVYSGPVKFGEDPFEIRRIAIHNRVTIAGFALRLVSPYEYLEWLWFRARNGSSQN